MMVSIKSNKGFSLVELMVVVAIIGILAAIAVPNFQKFAAKAKTSEAKSELSALYSAERAFYSEWNWFYSDFVSVGYGPTGILRYDHGFGTATAAGSIPGFTGTTSYIKASDYCGTVSGTSAGTANFCSATAHALPTTVTPSATVFTAGASGDISNGVSALDQWTIDQSKNLIQTQVGY